MVSDLSILLFPNGHTRDSFEAPVEREQYVCDPKTHIEFPLSPCNPSFFRKSCNDHEQLIAREDLFVLTKMILWQG